jgi:hypothetical protein
VLGEAIAAARPMLLENLSFNPGETIADDMLRSAEPASSRSRSPHARDLASPTLPVSLMANVPPPEDVRPLTAAGYPGQAESAQREVELRGRAVCTHTWATGST